MSSRLLIGILLLSLSTLGCHPLPKPIQSAVTWVEAESLIRSGAITSITIINERIELLSTSGIRYIVGIASLPQDIRPLETFLNSLSPDYIPITIIHVD